jgi:hypothetical protein
MISQLKTRVVLLRNRLHSLRMLELVSNKDRSGFCLGERAVQRTYSRLCLLGCKAALEAGRRLCKLVSLRINASGINLTKLRLKGHLGLVPPGLYCNIIRLSTLLPSLTVAMAFFYQSYHLSLSFQITVKCRDKLLL